MNKQQLVDFIWDKLTDVLIEIRINKNDFVDDPSTILAYEKTNFVNNHRTIVKIKKFDNFKKLNEILNKINFEYEISKKYSQKYIEDKFVDLLHNVIDSDDAVTHEQLDIFITELFNSIPKEFIIISKLENIEISEDLEYHLLDSVIKVFHKNELESDSDIHKSQIFEMDNTPIIFTTVSAVDNKKLKELALINFETTFNFIKLIYPNFDAKLTGAMLSGRRDFLIIKDWSMKSISSNVEWIGDSRVNEARLNSPIYEKLKDLKFETISEIQQKYLKDCLYWYGQGLKTENNSNKIINFVTILESLLKLKGEKTELNKSISERGAVMLNDSFEYRLLIKNELKEIYNVRSDIVHTGELTGNNNISTLAGAYARQIILRYITLAQRYKSHEELVGYLDNLKLGFIEEKI